MALGSTVVRTIRVAFFSFLTSVLFTAAGTAQPADTLRVGNWDFPPGRGNPYSTVSAGVPQVYIWPAMFDALAGIDATGSASPLLAASWTNIDPTTWRVDLRPNVKFHNGAELSAKTVTDIFDWFQSDAGKPSVVAGQMKFIESVRETGPLSLEFKTTSPRPVFPNLLAGLYLVPEKAWADRGPEGFVTNPIGSGSYKTVAWTNEAVKMEAFEDAWRPAKTPKLEILRLAESAARLQALVSNQIDVMVQVQADQFGQIRSAGGRIETAPAPALLFLAYVLENAKDGVNTEPLHDKRVRHALNYAVNREAINDNLLGGLWTLNSQFAVPGAFGYDPTLESWPYDPEKAKKLLTEAGYPNGFKLTGEVRDFFDIWAQVQSDLAKVGVDLELNNIVQSEWLKKFLGTSWDGASFSLALGFGPEMDAGRVALWQSCRKDPAHYCNQQVMPLIDAIDAEFDAEKRKDMLHRLMGIMREDTPALMLFEQVDFFGLSGRVEGFESVNRIFNFHDMTLAN